MVGVAYTQVVEDGYQFFQRRQVIMHTCEWFKECYVSILKIHFYSTIIIRFTIAIIILYI